MYLKPLIVIFLLSIHLYFANCVDLKQIENNLSSDEEIHSLSSAFNAIEKSSSAAFIAQEIVNEMRYRFGGKWNCFIFVDRNQSGAFDLQVIL